MAYVICHFYAAFPPGGSLSGKVHFEPGMNAAIVLRAGLACEVSFLLPRRFCRSGFLFRSFSTYRNVRHFSRWSPTFWTAYDHGGRRIGPMTRVSGP